MFAYALIHDFWTAIMSNFLIVESRRNDVIIMFLNLCTLYCRINNFLLMFIVSRLIEEENWKEFIARFLFRRPFLEIDLLICWCFVSAWILWLSMWKFECWLSRKDKRANDLLHSSKEFRCRKIWLFDWWRDRTNKRFWLADELHDEHIWKNSVRWSLWSEREDFH